MKKMSSFMAGWFLIAAASTPSGYAQSFTLGVEHKHIRGHCTGKLIINQEGIEYDTENSKDHRRWSYHDLKRIEISSRKELILSTYVDLKYRLGAEKNFKFKLQEGEITPGIYQFLLSKATRPVLTRVSYPSTPFLFTLPVKHRHLLRGCQGELKVGEDRVVYETTESEDSRTWFYKDIESIGLMDSYSFRLTTFGENYTFDLKVPMSTQQYEFLWARVYQLENLYSRMVSPGCMESQDQVSRRGSGFRSLGLQWLHAETADLRNRGSAAIGRRNPSAGGVPMHWPGPEVPVEMDGVPRLRPRIPSTQEGNSFTNFPAINMGRSFYHTHMSMQLMMGLIGISASIPRNPTSLQWTRDKHSTNACYISYIFSFSYFYS